MESCCIMVESCCIMLVSCWAASGAAATVHASSTVAESVVR
jgi:hypothetical protein